MSVFDDDLPTLKVMAREAGSKCVASGVVFYGLLSRDDLVAVDESGMAVRSRERILRLAPGDLPDTVVRETEFTVYVSGGPFTYRLIGLPDEPEEDGYLHYRVVRI